MTAVEPALIWGAGAIGGTIGAYLVRAGRDVVFVDVVPEHVAAINSGALTIEGPIDSFTVKGKAVTPDAVTGVFPLVFLAVKSNHTIEAARALAPHVAENGMVVSLQNGLNELLIAEAVGRERTVGAFVNLSADWLEPGRIMYGARSPLVVGELDGRITPRVEAVAELLRLFEPEARATDNLFGYLWGKSSYSTFQSYSALADAPMADFMADPHWRLPLVGLIREVLELAVAEGARPVGFQGYDPDAFLSGDEAAMDRSLMANREFKMRSAKKYSGYWRDLAVRKRPTDITAQFAPIRALAEKRGHAMPLVDKLLALIGAVERGERTLGPDIAEEVRALAMRTPGAA